MSFGRTQGILNYPLGGVAPPGWEPAITKMKKSGDNIDNPWALAWHMKKKGYKPGGAAASEMQAMQKTIPYVCYQAAQGEGWAQNQLLNEGGFHIHQEEPW